MTLRNIPQVAIGARPGVRSDVSPDTFERWVPGLRAETKSDDASISILDVIGQDFWGEGVTEKRIAAALRNIGKRPVTVTINSPGGDIFQGIAIYNLLREHPEHVTVKVVGLAASAASVIAMAGDQIEIGKAAFMMIHNSWVCACGNQHTLREVADYLEPFDAAMADVYAVRSGGDVNELRGLMDAETWLNGSDAVDRGLADAFLPSDDISRDIDTDDVTTRAERQFDILASKAGLSRSHGKELLAALKGGAPGAASTGMPGAAAFEQGVSSILADLKSIKG